MCSSYKVAPHLRNSPLVSIKCLFSCPCGDTGRPACTCVTALIHWVLLLAYMSVPLTNPQTPQIVAMSVHICIARTWMEGVSLALAVTQQMLAE